MDKLLGCLVLTAGFVGLVFVLSLLFALPTMWLWNALVPDITKDSLTHITFWQAWGLNFLCSILFKSQCAESKSK